MNILVFLKFLLHSEYLCLSKLMCSNADLRYDNSKRGGLGRCLGQEGGALGNGVSALKRGPTELPGSFCLVKTQHLQAAATRGLSPEPDHL